MSWTDDPALLDIMLEDWRNGGTANEVPGELVKMYDDFAEQLRTYPLGELSARRVRGLTAISAVDDIPSYRPLLRLENAGDPAIPTASIAQALRFAEAEPTRPVLPYDLSLADLEEAAFRMCDLYGRLAGAVSVAELEMGTAHNPLHTFAIKGKRYSYLYLYYYLQYAYCAQFLDFESVSNIVEVGPGLGRAVEILRKAHPHLRFYLVDLAPTLYVCQRNLAALFPESVVPYAETRAAGRISDSPPGSISFLGPHQLEALAPAGPTLSFNAGVMSNMTPQTVRRYLSRLKVMATWLYLMEPGRDETKRLYSMPEAPTSDTYRSELEPDFRLLDRSEGLKPLSVRRDFGGFEATFWIRKRSADGSDAP